MLVKANLEEQVSWSGYQHTFGGNATRAERTDAGLDFDSPLMRLATGGQ